jgi:hypothetical protein
MVRSASVGSVELPTSRIGDVDQPAPTRRPPRCCAGPAPRGPGHLGQQLLRDLVGLGVHLLLRVEPGLAAVALVQIALMRSSAAVGAGVSRAPWPP